VGGNLFKLPRMPRAEYLERERAVRAYLEGAGFDYRVPRYYGNKPDFGDMDVLLPTRLDWDVVRQKIAADLGVTETKSVGRVFSMAYRGLQTDLFAVSAEFLDSTYEYLSFNDLGNLLGRICKRFNLKWGEQGLAYVFRRQNTDHYAADLPITTDFRAVCRFLGLDHAVWATGFPTLPDLYAWVIRSPYFSVAPYLDEQKGSLSHRQERPTIAGFVEWLRANGIEQRPELGDKHSYVDQIAEAFPAADLHGQIAAERAKEVRVEQVAARFSGKLVMRLRPELQGPAIGELIVAFKRSVGESFEDWVLATPPEEIERAVREFVVPAKL
jgi:hypothetical protein